MLIKLKILKISTIDGFLFKNQIFGRNKNQIFKEKFISCEIFVFKSFLIKRKIIYFEIFKRNERISNIASKFLFDV